MKRAGRLGPATGLSAVCTQPSENVGADWRLSGNGRDDRLRMRV